MTNGRSGDQRYEHTFDTRRGNC